MPDNDVALSIKHLYKDFLLPHERKNSLKEWVLHFRKPSYEKFHALHDIDFEVERGEFFGIVGRNGSGKSTLLKIIGGIYQPTRGNVTVNGTLTPFIELGIGFNPELTGRENVYLNGAILGLTRKEVEKIYQEVVDFAEIENFMDQKLKNYSSGMQVRLAFSIAIQAHNDILLIDEVLAVGDAAFQRKCYDVFKQIKKSGKTVIFVTHDMGAIQEYCDRAMMIEDSKVLTIGKPREVALRYEVANSAVKRREAGDESSMSRPKDQEVELLKVVARSAEKATSDFGQHDDIFIDIDFKANTLDEAVQFNVFLVKPDGTYLAGLNTVKDLGQYNPSTGKHRITCQLKAGQLVKGDYYVNTGVYTYAEPARLIDILDVSYGVEVPRITIHEVSKSQNGEFNMQGQWKEIGKMKGRKAVGKIGRALPISGSYLKNKEEEVKGLNETIKRLEDRNDEWAAEVRQLRGDDKMLEILLPVFKEDLIAADYTKKGQNFPAVKRHEPPYILNWIVPPIGPVSGGHSVIMHLIRFLESQGHTCRIYFYDGLGGSSLADIKENMKNHVPVKAEIFYNAKEMARCDAIFATSWPTAYPVYNYKGSAKKFYLLQDFEPMFEPSGSYSALAENTYKMGLHGISTTPFTAIRTRQEYGMETDEIELGIEPSEYFLTNEGPRKKVVFYSRPVTPRRGFELGTLALEVFHKRHPEYEINCIGWDIARYDIPFPYVNNGILPTAKLNELYNQCAAGLVLSFTSMSLTVVEMMAAGCLPVMNQGPDSTLVKYRKYLRCSEPNPTALAECLYEAIESQNKDSAQAKAMADFSKKFSWSTYNQAFQNILVRELS